MAVERAGGRAFTYKQAIKKAERRLQETFGALGIRTYNLIKEGGLSNSDLVEVVDEIDAIRAEIEEHEKALEVLRMQREAARGTKCPYCGSMASPGAKFCPRCGQGVDQPPIAREAETDTKQCPYCGGIISSDAVFCGMCGMNLAARPSVSDTMGSSVTPPAPETPMTETTPSEEMGDTAPPGLDADTGNKCIHCGEILPSAATFCVNCGESTR